jgi:hypothetical protein
MSARLTTEAARQSLREHVAAKGSEIRLKYGPRLGWAELQRLLEDRAYVRYPCELVFDADPLLPGEFAYPKAKGARPEDGFVMCIHPVFRTQLERVLWLVLYQLVAVNYGVFASATDAECFGAAALGLGQEEYYDGLCQMAAEVEAAAK